MKKGNNSYLKFIKSFNRKNKAESSSTASQVNESRNNFVESTKKRIEKNPILDIIETAKPYKDDALAKKWKNVATFNTLGNTLALIGQGMSVANGGRASNLDKTPTYMAVKYIDKMDDNYRADSDKYFKSRLAEAIRGENIAYKNAQWYADTLEKDKDRSLKLTQQGVKNTNDYYKQQRSQDNMLDRMDKNASVKAQSQNANSAYKSTTRYSANQSVRKPVTYIKNINKESVPVYQEDWTELYRVADAYGILDDFKKGKNSDQRRNALNVAIQKAYTLRERDLKGNADMTTQVTKEKKYTPHPINDNLTVK